MGNIIKWQIPDSTEATYDQVEIYRATSKTGTYNLVAQQDISDNTYFDINGDNDDWYKVRFKLSTSGTTSGYSAPIRADSAHGYCTIDDLRLLTGLSSSDVTDSDLLQIQRYAVAQLNGEIGARFENDSAERILYISNEKENDIDGSNTEYYVAFPYLGDRNCDGRVDEDDVTAYSLSANGDRTDYTIESIDATLGKITLASAPASGESLYIEYMSVPLIEDPAHQMVKLAICALVAAIASTKINPNNADSFRVGKISVKMGSGPFNKHMERYQTYVQNIRKRMVRTGPSADIHLGDYVIGG